MRYRPQVLTHQTTIFRRRSYQSSTILDFLINCFFFLYVTMELINAKFLRVKGDIYLNWENALSVIPQTTCYEKRQQHSGD